MNSHRARVARFVVLAIFGCAAFAIVAAPLARRRGNTTAAAVVYALFSTICHQRPERSFSWHAEPFPVCQRCTGIYFGLFVAALVARGVLERSGVAARRAWIAAATLPLLVDVGLGVASVWSGNAVTRAATGFLFGSMLATILMPAVTEFAAEPLHGATRRGAVLGEAGHE
jgi:uncharacterized membrane protein